MADYKCKKCGAKFEKSASSCGCSCSIQAQKCPQCGSAELEETEGSSTLADILNLINSGSG